MIPYEDRCYPGKTGVEHHKFGHCYTDVDYNTWKLPENPDPVFILNLIFHKIGECKMGGGSTLKILCLFVAKMYFIYLGSMGLLQLPLLHEKCIVCWAIDETGPHVSCQVTRI